jgi:hypothetical protein
LQGRWPKMTKVFLLLFVHKKKFLLFLLLFKIISSFVRLGSCLFVHNKENSFYPLGANISHQPAGEITPATILHRLFTCPPEAGLKIKYTHWAQTLPFRGTSW